jgi:hypothetical protein
MNKKKYILLVIIISIIISAFIEVNLKNNYNIFEIVGGSIAFILWPYIITSLIKYRFKITSWNWNFEDKSFLKTYTIVYCISVILNVVGATN